MKPRLTVLTLGVDDLERALRFYHDGLGWPTEGIIGNDVDQGAVAFFELQSGLHLALYPRAGLARDAGLTPSRPAPADVSLGHNVSSREAVDEVMRQAAEAGATIVDPPRQTFWGGYSGYFMDPDEHLWEVVWNPQLVPDD